MFPEDFQKLPNLSTCQHFARLFRALGGRVLLVGGCVRDTLLGLPAKDIDVEVYGITPTILEKTLRQHFRIAQVGKAFGVFKFKDLEIDISIPRTESKSGTGHKGFEVRGDPSLSFKEAAKRRDFTINAISWDPLTGELIDPLSGLEHLRAGILHPCSEAFGEDPLRVLRGMQFVARFEMRATPQTIALCQSIEPEDLPAERLFEEWSKWLLKGKKPSLGLQFLREVGWVSYYSELRALINCPQDPIWHPEGDVWTHTLHCMDAFAQKRVGDREEDLIVGFAVLCHDFGKPLTTFLADDGRIRSPKHENEGEIPTRSFLERLTREKGLVESVVTLVRTHLRPMELYKAKASDSAIRRLAKKVRMDRLVRVAQADMEGRPPKSTAFPEGKWLLERAKALEIENKAPVAIVMGRHLIERGLVPGPDFGRILKACYEAQLDGVFEDLEGGEGFLERWLEKER